MIRVDKGEVEFEGSVATVFAEISCLHHAVIASLDKNDDADMEVAEVIVKSLIMRLQDIARDNGINYEITDDDIKAHRKAQALATNQMLSELLDSLDDEEDDDSTEDDIPNYLF